MSPWPNPLPLARRRLPVVLEVTPSEIRSDTGVVVVAAHGSIADALRHVLQNLLPHTSLHVRLSEACVRYRLLPWRDDLFSDAAWRAYALQCFVQAGMALNERWALQFLPVAYGQARLVWALPAEIDQVLRHCAVPVTLSTFFLDSLSFNSLPFKGRSILSSLPFKGRARVGMGHETTKKEFPLQAHPHPRPPLEGEGVKTDAVHGVLESGQLTLAQMQNGQLHAVQSLRFTLAPSSPSQLQRHRLMLTGTAGEVLVHARVEEAQALQQQGIAARAWQLKCAAHALSADSAPAKMHQRQARAQVACALLAPVVAVMLMLSWVRIQSNTQEAGREVTKSDIASSMAVPPFSDEAKASARSVAQWMSPRWQPLLDAVESTLPPGFQLTRLQVDAGRSLLYLEAQAPDMAQVGQWAHVLSARGWGDVNVTQVALERGSASSSSSKSNVRFEMSVPWTP